MHIACIDEKGKGEGGTRRWYVLSRCLELYVREIGGGGGGGGREGGGYGTGISPRHLNVRAVKDHSRGKELSSPYVTPIYFLSYLEVSH